ncbi:MAG: DsbA family oxidoreductase [Marinomonas sp.]
MKDQIDIQFVSDIMCPWCVVGLENLKAALIQLDDKIDAKITFQPFELNPDMPQEGQDFDEHIQQKYGISKEQSDQNRQVIKERGQAVDFIFSFKPESRMWNSFDAHRLLHWAEHEEKQAELKLALFKAHFTHGQNISNHDVLASVAAAVDLDPKAAKGVLEKGQFTDDVRQKEAFWQKNGITSVPTIIVNNKYAISGAQPSETFKQALEDIMNKENVESI